jgi:UDP-glucuronate decarboxylase
MRTYSTRRRVLVTGGAGFLGSHLCEKLLAQDQDVLCVDNFFTGTKDNIAHLLGNPGFELLRHDVTFPLYVEVDEIYNLACPASPVHYQFDPVQTTKTSVHGAINMLGLAKRVKAKILQASTSEVYGDPEVHPQKEDYWGRVNPIGLRSCYDEGKRCAETLFFDYHRQHHLRVKVARIFNTYGPRMHPNDGRVVSNFIMQALRGEPITIFGRGTQTRSFCYVDDLIEALVGLMATPDAFTGQYRQPGRVHDPRTGQKGDRDDGVQFEDRLPSAAQRRPVAAQARYQPGEIDTRLGAANRPGGGARQDDRVFPSYGHPAGNRALVFPVK